jgi:DMSO/TMAO reductase YedYZ molybdopterin-dependent catalytic subunit
MDGSRSTTERTLPGWYGCAAIKWVNEIALVDGEAVATDHMREYAGRTHQPPGLSQVTKKSLTGAMHRRYLPRIA